MIIEVGTGGMATDRREEGGYSLHGGGTAAWDRVPCASELMIYS
jgi:hypothetical protein